MSLKIEHAHLVLPYQVLQDAWLISREGKITAYGCGVSPQQTFSTVIDAKGQYLTPGFVDLHVHGGAGADFRDGEEAAFVRAMQAHLAGGTTTMLATVSSTTLEGTLESLRIYEAMRQREAQPASIWKGPIFRKRSGARRMRRSSACRMRRNTSVFWSRPPACAAGPSPVNFPVR